MLDRGRWSSFRRIDSNATGASGFGARSQVFTSKRLVLHSTSLTFIKLTQRLESATRSLQMQAPHGVLLESQAGDISATCYEDLRLRSTGGTVKRQHVNLENIVDHSFHTSTQIKIDSSSVMLPNIRTALVTSKAQRPAGSGQQQGARSSVQIFQVCFLLNDSKCTIE